MKKRLFGLICLSLIFNFAFAATDISPEDIKSILSGMEIIGGNAEGNTIITRRDLAEVLVKASESKAMAEATIRLSPFSDVSYDSENASYIRLAAINGYMTAYLDGNFKPDNTVKNEEAVTAVLKLLGYKNSDFTQSYPYEQLTIAKNSGLTEGVDTTIGGTMTAENLQRLVYNALIAKPKSGNEKYVETLGYSITNGSLTISDVMAKNVEGPVTYTTSSKIGELTGIVNPTVYVNGKHQSEDELSYYDVLYYSTNSNTVWAYRDKITGLVENISPNKEAPNSVTISGKSYKLTSYKAQKAFSLDGYNLGNVVTLLLDRNGEVADVYLAEELYSEQVGVIISSGKKNLVQSDGNSKVTYYADVLLSTGETMEVSTSGDYSKKVGYTAKISFKNGKATVYSTSKTTDIYGTFDLTKNKIGNKYSVSKEVKILETDDYGNSTIIYPERLDGVYLQKENVALVIKDSKDVITNILLKNTTGDTAEYGIITEVVERNDDESYVCVINGSEKTYNNSEMTFNVENGPAIIYLEKGSLGLLKNLERVEGSIVNVNNAYVENSRGEKFKVSSDVAVYAKSSLTYNLSDMDTAMRGEYNVTAYYDKTEKEGGRIRVIVLS